MTKILPSFDRMVEMAQKDPDALERLRQDHIAALIEKSPEAFRQRLRGLQFQFDVQRRTSKNPMDACIKASKMMHDSLSTLRDYLKDHESSLHSDSDLGQNIEQISADILPFRQPA